MKIDDIEIKLIRTKCELKLFYPLIAELFEESFSKSLDFDLWNWLYIENPTGDPLVALGLHKGKLVGHYALIPMPFMDNDLFDKSYIAITTMVSFQYRRVNLYQVLADLTYQAIDESEVPTIVFGFPNDNAKVGCRKRLKWSIDEDYCIAKVNKVEYGNLVAYLNREVESSKFSVQLNKDFEEWRTNKPSGEWQIINRLGVKSSNNYNDLMYCDRKVSVEDFASYSELNVLLNKSDVGDLKFTEAFSYRFGFRLFNSELDKKANFFLQMCLSDVF